MTFQRNVIVISLDVPQRQRRANNANVIFMAADVAFGRLRRPTPAIIVG
jgi:hypothetical protein